MEEVDLGTLIEFSPHSPEICWFLIKARNGQVLHAKHELRGNSLIQIEDGRWFYRFKDRNRVFSPAELKLYVVTNPQ